MAVCEHLPFELLAHIVSYLSDDTCSLRNVSLSSRTFDAISKPHLFTVIGFRNLSRPDLIPFRHFARELKVTWGIDMLDNGEVPLLEHALAPYLSLETTPRLTTLSIGAIGSPGMAYLSTLGKVFASFPGLTTLTLKQTQHRGLRDLQTLICALPHLKHLHLSNVVLSHRSEYGEHAAFEAESDVEQPLLRQGPHLKTLSPSATFPACSLEVITWLAETPTMDSLRTLTVPFQAHNAPALVPLYGPSVHELTVPLRRLEVTSLERYCALQSLTLGLTQYHARTDRWTELPVVLSSLPSPAVLRSLTLTLQLRGTLRSDLEFSEAIVRPDMLQEADCILCMRDTSASPKTADKERTAPKFSALRELVFMVRTPFLVSEEKQVAFERMVMRLMAGVHAQSKLLVGFEISP